MEQRTLSWHEARLGKLTASRINDALSFLARGGEAEKRIQYRLELASERLTGLRTEFFENYAMKWGTECEPLARAAYEAEHGVMVKEVGFINHPSIEWAGASPDGLVEDGLLEIKCPTTTTHLKYLLDGNVPEQYKKQMMWQMLCTERKWCDFVSFDPRLPEELQMFVKRFEPEETELKDLEAAAVDFLSTVEAMISNIEQIGINDRQEAA